MDLRVQGDSIRRTVTNAQANIERLRHQRTPEVFSDLDDCLTQLTREAETLVKSAKEARMDFETVKADG